MKREFVIKMMKAKKLQYEALKEIMPEKMVHKIADLENEIVATAKEYIMTEFAETGCEKKTSGEAAAKKVNKVTIEA